MGSTKSKLNVTLLRKIQAHILEEPRRFIMDDLVRYGLPGDKFSADNDTQQTFAECGTAACIAGWALLLSGIRIDGGDYLNRASDLLRISDDHESLFIAELWPEPFKRRYARAGRPATRAKIAAARIEHLITTGK